jgi:hypothetical protein
VSHNEEKHRPRVFENRVLRKIFGPEGDEVTGNGEDYIMGCFMTCTLGFIQKPTFEKNGFRIPVFPKKKPVFEFLQKM